MIRGFYSAATALDVAARNQEMVAQNLAHATVPGYRSQALAFETFERTLADSSDAAGLGTRTSAEFTRFDPGAYQQTGNTLDVAIQGEGFFTVEGPKGPLYTRDGVFSLNSKGEILTTGGNKVLGTGGPLRVPAEATKITITQTGTVSADGAEVGRLRLVAFANLADLQRAGTTLFEAPRGVEPKTLEVKVTQGMRESSNVEVVGEMVTMIAGMRHYEACQHTLRALSDAIEQLTRPQAA